MTNPIQNALNFLQTNNVKPNAQNMQYIQALQSGDKNAGQQLANQFCQQNTNALSTQLAQCCCENRQGQAQIQYDMATNTCAIQNAIQNQTQQIIQNDNANYRQLHDEIVANRMEDLKSKIADQAQEINQLNLSASQCQQNAYLISQLRPNPVPAFQVANPFASMYTGCCNNNVAI